MVSRSLRMVALSRRVVLRSRLVVLPCTSMVAVCRIDGTLYLRLHIVEPVSPRRRRCLVEVGEECETALRVLGIQLCVVRVCGVCRCDDDELSLGHVRGVGVHSGYGRVRAVDLKADICAFRYALTVGYRHRHAVQLRIDALGARRGSLRGTRLCNNVRLVGVRPLRSGGFRGGGGIDAIRCAVAVDDGQCRAAQRCRDPFRTDNRGIHLCLQSGMLLGAVAVPVEHDDFRVALQDVQCLNQHRPGNLHIRFRLCFVVDLTANNHGLVVSHARQCQRRVHPCLVDNDISTASLALVILQRGGMLAVSIEKVILEVVTCNLYCHSFVILCHKII